MDNLSIKTGKSHLEFNLDHDSYVIFNPKSHQPQENNAENIVIRAFSNPVYYSAKVKKDLKDRKIAIAINDQTRPLPHSILLPCLLDYLINDCEAKKEDISFYIATGTHRQLTKNEVASVLPANLNKGYTYQCHDCDNEKDLLFLGETAKGTPVYGNKGFYQSEVKIVVGNIEPHHFMGFSGGVKTAAIGLTGRKTIERNHAMLPHPKAKMGLFLDNPMRSDVEEIGHMIAVDFALNVVLDDKKEIISAFWGDPYSVMEKGIPVSLESCQLDIPQSECMFDLVIASAGGHPKDINLYQSQKALTNACLFSRENGVIILAAECPNGAGNDKFLRFLQDKSSPQEIIQSFTSRPFEIGPHKAYQLALQALNHKIILISDIPPGVIPEYLVTPARDMREALKIAAAFLPDSVRTAVLPFATHTMPVMEWPGTGEANN